MAKQKDETKLTRVALDVPIDGFESKDLERIVKLGMDWGRNWIKKKSGRKLENWECGVIYGERTDGSTYPLAFFRGDTVVDFSNVRNVHAIESDLKTLAEQVAEIFPGLTGTLYCTRVGDLPMPGAILAR